MSKWVVDIHGEIEGDYKLICKAESTIPLDKVKQAREEISKSCYKACINDDGVIKESEVLKILDKLIESEG